MEMTWKPISTSPLNTPILVTDGEIVTITNLRKESYGMRMQCVGWGGYEWEYDIDYKDLTHWTEVPLPPK